MDRANPRVDRANPRVDRASPRVDRANPRVDRADPRVDRANPRVDRANPRVDRACGGMGNSARSARFRTSLAPKMCVPAQYKRPPSRNFARVLCWASKQDLAKP